MQTAFDPLPSAKSFLTLHQKRWMPVALACLGERVGIQTFRNGGVGHDHQQCAKFATLQLRFAQRCCAPIFLCGPSAGLLSAR